MNACRWGLGIVVAVVVWAHGQWTQLSGPEAAYVYSFAHSGDTVWAGTANGVFRSVDAGVNWEYGGLALKYTPDMCYHGEYVYAAAHGAGLYRTDRTTKNWSLVDDPRLGNSQSVSGVHSWRSALVACTYDSLYLSTDSGDSWTKRTSLVDGAPAVQISCFAHMGARLFVHIHGVGPSVSIDSGSTWEACTVGIARPGNSTRLVPVDGHLFAAVWHDDFYRSDDSGATWSSISGGLPQGTPMSISYGGGVLYVSTISGSVFRSEDLGVSWTDCAPGKKPIDDREVVCAADSFLLLAEFDGLMRSEDSGQSWSQANSGLLGAGVLSMAVRGDTMVATAGYAGLHTSHDGGASWRQSLRVAGEKTEMTAQSVVLLGTVFLAWYGGTSGHQSVVQSVDYGTTFQSVGVLPASQVMCSVVRDDTVWVGTVRHGTWYSPDGGVTWTVDTVGLPNLYAQCLAASSDYLFVGTSAGLFRKTGSGDTWHRVKDNYVNTVAAEDSVIVTKHGYFVYISWTQADTWDRSVRPTGQNVSINAMGVSDRVIYVAGPTAVYSSTDRGQSWDSVAVNEQLGNIKSFVFTDSTVFALTDGQGVWKARKLDLIGGVTTNRPRRADGRVGQGATCPANQEILVFDLRGRLVQRTRSANGVPGRAVGSGLPHAHYVLSNGTGQARVHVQCSSRR